MQVIIDGKPMWPPLELHWPAKYFDQAAGLALPQRTLDKVAQAAADDVNL